MDVTKSNFNSILKKYFVVIIMLWLSVVSLGTYALYSYAGRAGESADAPATWPQGSKLQTATGIPTLLLFAHPKCPCSTASVAQLELLLTKFKNKVNVSVIFIQPQGRTRKWVEDSLWKKVATIPSVNAVIDPNYLEADLFGAKTSGQVFFYDAEGTLVFSGGITPSRGHQGDSRGQEIITSWMNGTKSDRKIAKVFGCALKEGQLAQLNNQGKD